MEATRIAKDRLVLEVEHDVQGLSQGPAIFTMTMYENGPVKQLISYSEPVGWWT